MNRIGAGLFGALLIAILVGMAHSEVSIGIKVSPHVIAMRSNAEWVTVHTTLRYSLAETSTITLNEIPVVLAFADDRGYLVAKFRMEDVKAIVAPPSATLVLTGMTRDGEPFIGSETVQVKG